MSARWADIVAAAVTGTITAHEGAPRAASALASLKSKMATPIRRKTAIHSSRSPWSSVKQQISSYSLCLWRVAILNRLARPRCSALQAPPAALPPPSRLRCFGSQSLRWTGDAQGQRAVLYGAHSAQGSPVTRSRLKRDCAARRQSAACLPVAWRLELPALVALSVSAIGARARHWCVG